MTKKETTKEPTAIANLIERRLRMRVNAESPTMESHPDEDAITAFVEGRLEAAEYSPVVSHLIECGVCRQTTAQLVRLEFELGESDEAVLSDDQPSRLGSFFTDLASHLVPNNEEHAVFAYQNPDSETEEPRKPAADSEEAKDDGDQA